MDQGALLSELKSLPKVTVKGEIDDPRVARALEILGAQLPEIARDWSADHLRHGYDIGGGLWSIGFNLFRDGEGPIKRWRSPNSKKPIWETSACVLEIYLNESVTWAGVTWRKGSCVKLFKA